MRIKTQPEHDRAEQTDVELVATLLGVQKTTVYNYINRNKFPELLENNIVSKEKIGRSTQVFIDNIPEFIRIICPRFYDKNKESLLTQFPVGGTV